MWVNGFLNIYGMTTNDNRRSRLDQHTGNFSTDLQQVRRIDNYILHISRLYIIIRREQLFPDSILFTELLMQWECVRCCMYICVSCCIYADHGYIYLSCPIWFGCFQIINDIAAETYNGNECVYIATVDGTNDTLELRHADCSLEKLYICEMGKIYLIQNELIIF